MENDREKGSEKMRNIIEQQSACITTYTRAPKKQSKSNTDDLGLIIFSYTLAAIAYGFWIVSIILGVNPW